MKPVWRDVDDHFALHAPGEIPRGDDVCGEVRRQRLADEVVQRLDGQRAGDQAQTVNLAVVVVTSPLAGQAACGDGERSVASGRKPGGCREHGVFRRREAGVHVERPRAQRERPGR